MIYDTKVAIIGEIWKSRAKLLRNRLFEKIASVTLRDCFLSSSSYLPPSHKHTCRFRIVVVKEKAFACVKRGDSRHILVGEREVENLDVLSHPFDVCRFGNNYHATLDEPAQGYLCHALAVFHADFSQLHIGKKTVATLCEWSPRHDVRAEFLHDFLRFSLLVEHMGFYLIDSRNDLHVAGNVDEVVRVEVAHADGA